MSKLVSENDVVIAASLWLLDRGAIPVRVSMMTPVGSNRYSDERRLRDGLAANGMDTARLSFASDGPDIVAVSEREYWQVECKGAGSGQPSTYRTSFDRGLASVVSYFGTAAELPPECGSRTPILALAIPSVTEYLSQVRRRVRQSLRLQLSLWLLLCNPESLAIAAVSPTSPLADGPGT
jgi:hypothetical protein